MKSPTKSSVKSCLIIGIIGCGTQAAFGASLSLPDSIIPRKEPDGGVKVNPTTVNIGLGSTGGGGGGNPVTQPPPSGGGSDRVGRYTGAGGGNTGRRENGTSRDDSGRMGGGGRNTSTGGGRNPASPAPAPLPDGSLPTPIVQPAGGVIISTNVNVQWLTDYYFRGWNIFKRVSPLETNSAAATLTADGSFTRLLTTDPSEGLRVGVGYVESEEPLLSNGAAAALPPNNRVRFDNERFRIPPGQRYREWDFFANYTYPLIPSKLYATVGLGYYVFEDPLFWATENGAVDNSTEFQASLTYTGLIDPTNPGRPYVVPSVTYTRNFSGFVGNFWEAKLRGNFKLFDPNSATEHEGGELSFSPTVGISYDDNYNLDGKGWNSVEFGANFHYRFSPNTYIEVSANYVHDLGSTVKDQDTGRVFSRADDGFWASISLGFDLDPLRSNGGWLGTSGGDSKGPQVVAAPIPTKWSLSGGAAYRTINADFRSADISSYDALSLVPRHQGAGDLGFAGNGRAAHYRDGSVNATQFAQGTSRFHRGSGSEVLGSRDAVSGLGSRQVVFHSDRYAYHDSSQEFSLDSHDDDGGLSPYIKLMYDFGRVGPGRLGLGAQYSFFRTSLDSGLGLVALNSGYENVSNYSFIYDVDEINSVDNDLPAPESGNNYVIVDGSAYNSTYGLGGNDPPNPQRTEEHIQYEQSRVASFLHSKMDMSVHELAFPVEYKFDLTDRLHVGLSLAPTISLFEYELKSNLWHQSLPNHDDDRILSSNLGFKTRTVLRTSTDNDGSSSGGSGEDENNDGLDDDGTASGFGGENKGTSNGTRIGSRISAPTRPQTASSGKLYDPFAPRLPGRNVGRRHAEKSGQEWAFGLAAQATLSVDLDAQDRWFAEFFARYHWVKDFTVSNGLTEVTVDPSSFYFGLGLGVRF